MSIIGPQHTNAPLNISEVDGNPSVYPYKLIVPNGSLTDNGDGTASLVFSSATGTVTSVSVVNANGFDGTVSNPTTTPAITISTTITGILKGNGTAISAATPGTDYQTGTLTATRVPFATGSPATLTDSANLTFVTDTLTSTKYNVGSSTGAQLSASSGVLTIASIGNTNNENLTIDLESSSNTVKFSSGTGVNQYQFSSALNTAFGTTVDTTIGLRQLWNQSKGGIPISISGNMTNSNNVAADGAMGGSFTGSRSSNTGGNSGTITGVRGNATYSGTGTQVDAYGVYGIVQKITSASGVITDAYSIYGDTPIASGGGTITNSWSGGFIGNVKVTGTLCGGNASAGNLTIASTTNATKGKILFGNSAYDDANNYLSLGQSTGVCQLDMLIPGTGVTQGQLVTWTYTGSASGVTPLTACTYNLTNNHSGVGAHIFNAFKFNVTNAAPLTGSGVTLTFGSMDGTLTESAAWSGTGSTGLLTLSNIKSTVTDTSRTISKNPQGSFGLTYVAFDAVAAGFNNTTFTTGSKTYNTIGLRSVTSLVPVAVSSGTPVFNSYACDLSVTGSTLGTSTTYALYLRQARSADTNWGIYMNETTSTTNHKLSNDTQLTYFGTGNDATIAFTGTEFQLISDVVTSTDSFLLRAGTNGLKLAIGATTQLTVTSLTGTYVDAFNMVFGTSTGTKIGTATTQKIGFWNAAPIVQPTTGIAAATFVANTSGIVDDTATWDSYTIGQVVKALRNSGLLA